MLSRAWSFVVGLPTGLLVAIALFGEPSALVAQVAAGLGGGVLVAVVSLLARIHDDEPERLALLARASSASLLSLPAVGLALLELAPAPWMSAALVAFALVALLVQATRAHRPAGGFLGLATSAVVWTLGGAFGLVLLSGAISSFAQGPPPPGSNFPEFVYDVDSRIPLGPAPSCRPEVVASDVLLEKGAHPRLGHEASQIWFDAPNGDGQRQIHRIDRISREVTCWTCGEPGNNQRPYPGDSGAGLVFDTDRHATFWHPSNTEIHLIATRGAAPRSPSRRITFAAGRDDHALFAPGSQLVVWTHTSSGRIDVVSSTIRSGHGGLVLGSPAVLLSGGARWVSAVDWSSDGRSFIGARGNPLGPLSAVDLDFATGEERALEELLPSAGGVAFNGDGTWRAVASTRRGSAWGLLPGTVGFLAAPLELVLGAPPHLHRSTSLRIDGEGETPIDLGPLSDWGAPTGLALARDGASAVLGQRRRGADRRPEERLVEIRFDCDHPT